MSSPTAVLAGPRPAPGDLEAAHLALLDADAVGLAAVAEIAAAALSARCDVWLASHDGARLECRASAGAVAERRFADRGDADVPRSSGDADGGETSSLSATEGDGALDVADAPALGAGEVLAWLSALGSRRTVAAEGAEGETWLDAAVRAGGETRGAVRLRRRAGGGWSAEERALAASAADRVALALERETRRRAEAALDERRRHADAVEALTRLGSWRWDLDDGVITWSAEQLRIHGLDEATGPRDFPSFISRVHPDDVEGMIAGCQRAIDTGEGFQMEYRIVRPDGLERRLLAFGRMVAEPDGSRRRMVGTSQDVTERRATEDALRASEEAYRTIFDSSNDAIFVHDLETGAVLDANRRAWELNGTTLAALRERGMDLIGNGPPPFSADAALVHLRAAATGDPQRFEWMTVHGETGEEMWVEVSLQRVRILGEDRLLALVRDIRERKRAETSLKHSEESYRAIFNSAGLAIWVHDLETGAFLDVNQTAVDMYGWSVEEQKRIGVEGISWGEPPFTIDHAREHIRKAIEGTPQTFEWLGRRNDGKPFWAEVTLRRAAIGGVDRVLATARDIGDRRAAEEALRKSEENYRAIFHNVTAGIWVHDLETGEMLDVNEAGAAMYGYTVEEMHRVGHDALLSPGTEYTAERVGEYIGRAIAGEEPRFEWLGLRKDGGAVWGEVTLRRVRLGGDERILASARDITARKAAEEALRMANEALEARVAARTAELAAINAALEDEIAERREAEAEVRRQKAFFEDVIGSLESGVAVFDPQARFEYASPNSIHDPDLRAWSVGRTTLEYAARRGVDPGVAQVRHEMVVRAVETKVSVEAEELLRTAAGPRHMLRRALPILGPDGEVARVIGYSVDITERVRMADALREREEHFRRLIENAHDIVVILDGAGTMTYLSPSARRILGYEPHELEGRSSFDFIHPDDAHRVVGELSRVLADAARTGFAEYRFRHRDGAWRHMEAFGRALSTEPGAETVVANIRDVTERHDAQLALRASEARYRSVVEQVPAIIYTADAAAGTRPSFISPHIERMLGWRADEWLAMRELGFQRMHPDDRPRVEAEWDAALAEGRDFALEYRMLARDGRVVWVRDEAATLRDADGRPLCVQGVMSDITALVETTEALRRGEERFRALIENASDLITVLAPDGTYTYQSPSISRVLGYTAEELLGDTPFGRMHPDDVDAARTALEAMVAGPGTSHTVQFRFQHRDGGWRVLESTGRTLLPDSAEAGVLVVSRDVTERNEAAAALQRSEEHFRRLIENGTDYVMIVDTTGAITYIGPNVERMLGYTTEEMMGSRPSDLVHPDDVPYVMSVLEDIILHPGKMRTLQFRIRHKDGSWRVFENVGKTLLPDSAEGGVVSNGRDVTERNRAEEALRAATEEAERANRAKSEFLSRMSHELRTPMNSILGFAQLLTRAELPDGQRRSVQHILKAGRHLLTLINEVLEIARIESGRQNLSIEPVRGAALLAEALGIVRPLAGQWGVTLEEPEYAPGSTFVYADRQRLTQVLLNLLSNAIKYNRPGGHVRITVGPVDPTSLGGRDRLAIRVADTGKGIPADRVSLLFTPFARLGAEQTEVEGTGLGLALSQRLTEAMGGALVLESSSAEGSVFRLELRSAADPLELLEAPEASASSPSAAGARAATLLYVEDNLANLSLVEAILLSRPAWRTVPALQGQLGVELAREHRPDLVLLDLHLPDISGEEVLRRLRSDERTAGIPVVIISADATASAAERLLAAGADGYLSKPIDVDEFLETLDGFLAPDREDA